MADPPHDPIAERATLGAALLSREQYEQIRAILGPAGDQFYQLDNGRVWRAICVVADTGAAPDLVTVGHHLVDQKQDMLALSGLLDACPVAAQGTHYARIVLQHAHTRALQVAGVRLQQAADANEGTRAKLLQSVRVQLDEYQAQAGPAGDGLITWADLIATDFGDRTWLTRPLIQPGGQIALVGAGKAGKSLFALEWAIRACAGLPFLGHPADRALRGLYVDQENPHQELQRRLRCLGYDQRPDLLSALSYASFPNIGPLDTPAGASALLAMVRSLEPDIVWLDTISRMIAGKENDADTWLALYRLTLAPLKSLGVAVVRLDHFGKDVERGSRGSSAKTQDVDDVWELSAQGSTVRLERTHTRSGLGEGSIWLRREGRPDEAGTTAHTILDPDRARQAHTVMLGAAQLCARLDALGVPLKAGRSLCRQALLAADPRLRIGNELLAEVVRDRKANPGKDWAAEIMKVTGEPPWLT